MDWHMKNGWTGWTFDKQLFPYPEDTLGYLKSRGLLLGTTPDPESTCQPHMSGTLGTLQELMC